MRKIASLLYIYNKDLKSGNGEIDPCFKTNDKKLCFFTLKNLALHCQNDSKDRLSMESKYGAAHIPLKLELAPIHIWTLAVSSGGVLVHHEGSLETEYSLSSSQQSLCSLSCWISDLASGRLYRHHVYQCPVTWPPRYSGDTACVREWGRK